jgi:hypothetical protein
LRKSFWQGWRTHSQSAQNPSPWAGSYPEPSTSLHGLSKSPPEPKYGWQRPPKPQRCEGVHSHGPALCSSLSGSRALSAKRQRRPPLLCIAALAPERPAPCLAPRAWPGAPGGSARPRGGCSFRGRHCPRRSKRKRPVMLIGPSSSMTTLPWWSRSPCFATAVVRRPTYMCTGGPCRYWVPQIHERGAKKGEPQIHRRSLCRRFGGYTYLRKRPSLADSTPCPDH